MRINTLKCELEPAVAALQAELYNELASTERYVCMCVCVCNCTHMPLCSTPQILAPESSKRRSCSYGALHSTEFSIKIQIDANKWPSPIPRRVSETQLQLHYQAKSIERGEREGVTPRRSRPRINKLKFSPQLDNGNANAPESLISLFQ